MIKEILTAFCILVSPVADSCRIFYPEITVKNLTAKKTSVSSITVEWKADKNRDYEIYCEPVDPNTGYVDNMYLEAVSKDKCYITGLREGSEYRIKVKPILTEKEKKNHVKAKSKSVKSSTEKVEVIWDFPYEDGWTQCFAGESAAGLTAQPSWGAIQGCIKDPITDTGIMRNAYGDYCCAMGLWYGTVGDRFLVELENGVQFTTEICDSKGWADDADGDGVPDGRFHWFGGVGNGKCIVEFIHEPNSLPSCVAFTGNWGNFYWKGLNFDNIKSIKKINYGETVRY